MREDLLQIMAPTMSASPGCILQAATTRAFSFEYAPKGLMKLVNPLSSIRMVS